MTASNQSVKKEKIKRLGHMLAGIVILLHGFERLEHGHASHFFFFIAAILFLSVALFHHRLQARFPMVDAVFFFIEGMLSFIIACEYFEAGKKALPFVYILAGIMQLVAIVILKRPMR